MEKKKTGLLILGVCALVLTIIGVTYAYWQLRLSQESEDVITSSCFDVSLSEEKDAIFLEKAYPISDKEGENLKPFTFTITNNCKANAKYQINLEALSQYKKEDSVISISENVRLKSDYLKAKLNVKGKEGSIVNLTNDLKVNQTLTTGDAIAYEAYKLTTGYLGEKESKTYELRLWLDGDLKAETQEGQEAMNKTFASKITVTATYSKNAYKTLVDTILAEQTKTENSGDSGLYQVTHEGAEITYTDDTYYQNRLTQPELRYAGANPNNYVSFGETYTEDAYKMYNVMPAVGTTEDNVAKTLIIIN